MFSLCIFNPEHDLCLANGSPHYVPPQSALDFARRSASLMQILYPGAPCISASELSTLNFQPSALKVWGWNAVVKTQLLKAGFPASLLPSDESLRRWRDLQHRSTLLPLQPDCRAVVSEAGVGEMLALHGAVVLKAPWSGSGRGLRWVTGAMSDHDRRWLRKGVREQRCVVAEPRRQVSMEYALEYHVQDGWLRFVGYSLFQSSGGVYQGNLLLPDDEIAARVQCGAAQREPIERWLQAHIAPFYEGPLGVDCLLDSAGLHHVSELNLRHTMGLLAHAFLLAHPESAGRLWHP